MSEQTRENYKGFIIAIKKTYGYWEWSVWDRARGEIASGADFSKSWAKDQAKREIDSFLENPQEW